MKIIRSIHSIIILTMLMSCDKQVNILQRVSEMQAQTTNLLLDNMELCQDNSVVESYSFDSIRQSKVKLVVYSDSSACSPCRMKGLYIWNEITDEAKRLYGKDFGLYFIFSPKKERIEDVRKTYYEESLDYPILIDTAAVFMERNKHIPKEFMYHTFLLDQDNKVVLVGSPLHNEKIKELFFDTLEKLLNDKQ